MHVQIVRPGFPSVRIAAGSLPRFVCCLGFFYVKNHGIHQELIDREFEVQHQYFKLPEDVKASLPQVKWAQHELLGHEVGNRVAGVILEMANAIFTTLSSEEAQRRSISRLRHRS